MANLRRVLFSTMVLVASANAWAARYGMAGCGIGSLIFKDEPGKIQILAGTTNGIAGHQTSAISSGTSNCKDSPNEVAQVFIEENKMELLTDMSRGQGETLSSLAKILSCGDVTLLGKALQTNFDAIYPNKEVSGEKVQQGIFQVIAKDSALQNTCASTLS